MEAKAVPENVELYYFPQCPYCRRVLEVIEDLGIEDRVARYDVRADPGRMDALLRLTGKTQVPCLVVDGTPMHESDEINRYLCQTF